MLGSGTGQVQFTIGMPKLAESSGGLEVGLSKRGSSYLGTETYDVEREGGLASEDASGEVNLRHITEDTRTEVDPTRF